MTVKQLIARLQKLIKENKRNADLEVMYYDNDQQFTKDTENMEIGILATKKDPTNLVCMMNKDYALWFDHYIYEEVK